MRFARARLRHEQWRIKSKEAELEVLLADSRERERLLNTILDTVDVGIVAVDAGGRRLLTNSWQTELEESAAAAPRSRSRPNRRGEVLPEEEGQLAADRAGQKHPAAAGAPSHPAGAGRRVLCRLPCLLRRGGGQPRRLDGSPAPEGRRRRLPRRRGGLQRGHRPGGRPRGEGRGRLHRLPRIPHAADVHHRQPGPGARRHRGPGQSGGPPRRSGAAQRGAAAGPGLGPSHVRQRRGPCPSPPHRPRRARGGEPRLGPGPRPGVPRLPRHGRPGPALGPRGPAPDQPGPGQPRFQRDQVLTRRRIGAGLRQHRRRPGAPSRRGHRHGHDRRRRRAGLHPLLPQPGRPRRIHSGRRPGAVHHQGHRGTARRIHLLPHQSGPRQHLHPRASRRLGPPAHRLLGAHMAVVASKFPHLWWPTPACCADPPASSGLAPAKVGRIGGAA